MKNTRNITMVVLVGLLLGGYAFAQDSGYARSFYGSNAAPVLKVQNTGVDQIKIIWGTAVSTNLSVGIGTSTQTFNTGVAAYDTVIEVAAAVAGSTNSAGEKPLKVEYWCSVGADSISNMVTTATNDIAPGNHEWVDVGRWDTTVHLAYMASIAPGGNPKVLTSIDGNIAGTGNITIDVYKHADGDDTQTKIGTFSYVSPVYVWAAITGITNLNTTDDVSPGVINLPVNIPVARSDGIVVKAARATTATTGGLGITAELRK